MEAWRSSTNPAEPQRQRLHLRGQLTEAWIDDWNDPRRPVPLVQAADEQLLNKIASAKIRASSLARH
jgi:hypothetical protein